MGALRRRIERLVPRDGEYSSNWRIPHAVALLKIIREFLVETMSEEISDETTGIIQGFAMHPVVTMVTELSLALNDLKIGVVNDNLKGAANISGNSLKALDVENICYGLFLVDHFKEAALLEGKKISLEEARKRAAIRLKNAGRKVKGQEMTALRLREWGKDYDYNGKKVKGK